MTNVFAVRMATGMLAAAAALLLIEIAVAQENRIQIKSDGWQLVGDLNVPASDSPVPAVLLLNQAAGDRTVYVELSRRLAERAIASLRLDLRGHGESINLGAFVPGENPRDPKIWEAQNDVQAAAEFLRSQDRIDATRIGIVGASYSGEEMTEAGRLHGYVSAYVVLSPGSFSDESVRSIDLSGAPWLFITSRDERFLQDIRATVTDQSRTVEQIILRGRGHATDLLEQYPDLAERIAVWISHRLN